MTERREWASSIARYRSVRGVATDGSAGRRAVPRSVRSRDRGYCVTRVVDMRATARQKRGQRYAGCGLGLGTKGDAHCADVRDTMGLQMRVRSRMCCFPTYIGVVFHMLWKTLWITRG